MSKQQKTVFFVGDELVAGFGDARALGWSGRVLARTVNEPPILSVHLAHPGEDTAHLMVRWQDEVARRLVHDHDNRLVIGLGSHDLENGNSMARCRLHLANILDTAEQRMHLSTFVVGPPPRRDIPDKVQRQLVKVYKDVATRRGIPFVDTYTPLVSHEQWTTDMAISGGYVPRQAGYGLMAWLVLYTGWNDWLGVPERPSR